AETPPIPLSKFPGPALITKVATRACCRLRSNRAFSIGGKFTQGVCVRPGVAHTAKLTSRGPRKSEPIVRQRALAVRLFHFSLFIIVRLRAGVADVRCLCCFSAGIAAGVSHGSDRPDIACYWPFASRP